MAEGNATTDTRSPGEQGDNRRRPRGRWPMRCMALLLGLLPFIVAEVGLRLFVDDPAVEAVDYDPLVNLQQLQPLFQRDEATGRWIIPPQRFNFFQPASFAIDKPATTKRIFVLGGSTVQGRPYATETAFSSWLRLRLQAACPDLEFEVVNCGGVSYASYRVAKILDEVLKHQPDAIVLYTGHNEFLEDRTYAEVRSMGTVRRLASRIGSKSRLVRWVQGSFSAEPATSTTMSGEVDARLDHPGGLEAYRRDRPWRRGVEEHFAKTFRRMAGAAQRAGVPLLVCVPTADLLATPPFKTAPSDSLSAADLSALTAAWKAACDASAGTDTRLEACNQCLAIDSQHTGAHYLAGRLHYELGDATSAYRHLVAARDHDVCPLRATSSIVDCVVQTATEYSLPLVDPRPMFDQRNAEGVKIPDGVIDKEFFLDHVHPTIAGHQAIAAELAQQIESLGWYEPIRSAENRYRELVIAHQKTLGEEYWLRGKQRLEGLKKWAAGRSGEVGLEHQGGSPGP